MYQLSLIIAELVRAAASPRWCILAALVTTAIEVWKKDEPSLRVIDLRKERVRVNEPDP